MDAVYDELISENPFFVELKYEYANLYQHCISESWVICVPRIGSLNNRVFTVEDFCAHILVPSDELPETHYSTLTEKQVTVMNKVITVEINNSIPLQSHILFEETFYTEDSMKFKVWCVETPLEPASIKRGQHLVSIDQLLCINDCIDLLWTQSAGRHVLEKIELCVQSFLSRNKLMPTSIALLSDAVGELYTQCSQIAFQNRRLREKSKTCKQTMDTIKLAVESYMQHLIFDSIFKPICTCAAYEDSRLNKTIRNLAEIQLRDLDIRKDLYDTVPKAKQILSKINTYNTVLEKVLCLKNALNAINKVEKEGGKAILLTADDILPVFVFLVIKTGLPNWYSQFTYMKEFRFSARAKGMADETAFLITTLEAVIEHIRSGELIGSPNPESYYYESDLRSEHLNPNQRRNSTTESASTADTSTDETLEHLFELIKISHYDQIKEILVKNQKIMEESSDEMERALNMEEELAEILNEDDDNNSPELCHPLCNCKMCCRAISRNLMRTSPTVSSRDSHGLTALHIASIHGKANIVELLLSMGTEIEASDLNECTALHYAAARGHQNALLLLIHSGSNIIKTNIDKNTPLHLAANNGHLSCVKALIYFAEHCRRDLQINYANESGETALHLASKWGYEGIAKILIENGAEPSLQNKKNKTAFDYAHNLRILRILQSCSPNLYEFIHITNTEVAVLNVNTAEPKNECIKASDENTDSVNKSFENMKRIEKILRAISYGDVKLACFFMNINCPGKNPTYDISEHKYSTPCHPLCDCGCRELITKTGESDFDVNFSDANGNTALHFASRYGLTELCKILLQNNANVNSVSKNGQMPLHLAALNNKMATLHLLLESGADINAANVAGDTPIHDATNMGNIGAVKILLKYKPDVTIRNGLDKTALDIAKDKNNIILLWMLVIQISHYAYIFAGQTRQQLNGEVCIYLVTYFKIFLMFSFIILLYNVNEYLPVY